MAEQLHLNAQSKEERYQELIPQLKALLQAEDNNIAKMANLSAALRMAFGFFWVGFYLVDGQTLVLGPFQGDIACSRIPYGKGVCGTAWQEQQTIIVADVDKFAGHIACSSASRSEIVIPIFRGSEVIAVLDVDSDRLAEFDDIDARYLTEICHLL